MIGVFHKINDFLYLLCDDCMLIWSPQSLGFIIFYLFSTDC